MNNFDSWWAENHLKYQGITDALAQQIWRAAQTAANQSQPCEWCNSTSAKIDSLENQLELAIQHANDCDANAPWLTAAHTLCTDYRIEQGNISDRLESLRNELVRAYKHCDSEAEIATLRGNDNRKLRNANAMLEAKLDELSKKDAIGNSINCPNCGDAHEIEYGDEVMPDGTKKPSKLLAFYKCGNKTYLAGIADKAI